MNEASGTAGSSRYGHEPDPVAAVRASELPLYPATFGQAVARYWRKYVVFHGRASRSEYWWAILLNALVTLALSAAAAMTESISPTQGASSASAFFGVPLLLYLLATIIPSASVFVRRLHDANFSGWFYFLTWIPGFGGIIAIILAVVHSDPNGARFDR